MYFRQFVNNINLCSSVHINYKKSILDRFIYKNKDLAEQGSDEWLSVRKYTIGGSEMSTITGDNPYSKLDNLVSQKIGFSSFNGNLACRWGKIFEIVTTQLTERILNIEKIYETGSLEGGVDGQRYSPDGLAVMKVKCSDIIDNTLIETNEYCIVLFEFKSPYSSIPTGKIPKHYLPQVLTGLCSIPNTDFALFINNCYRKCCITDLNTTLDYDLNFHKRDAKLLPTEVLAFGLNIFYQTDIQRIKFLEKLNLQKKSDEITDSDDSDEYTSDSGSDVDAQYIFNKINEPKIPVYSNIPLLHTHIKNIISNTEPDNKTDNVNSAHIKDFGISNYYEFDDLLKLYDDGLISLHVCKPHICETYYNTDFLKAQELKPDIFDDIETSIEIYKKEINCCSGIIGYLPFKLFKSDIIVQERDPDYLAKNKDKIDNALNIIKNINNSDTEFEKIKKFKSYFPKSKILKNSEYETHDAFEFMPRNV
jgi:hypothetical protein